MTVSAIVMEYQAATATTLLVVISLFIVVMHRRRASVVKIIQAEIDGLSLTTASQEPTMLDKSLASALPNSVIFPSDAAAFKQSKNSYWAQQECEVNPSCFVRPKNTHEVCTAVTILKQEYDQRRNQTGAAGLFAVRGGGHSPISGAASIRGGVVIDLRLFDEVTPSEDGSSVVIGAGAKWMDVSKVLDDRGLAVVGGRDSAVGVGGLTLGGGISFFSSRFGLVCSNILSYELVLASGSVTTASATTNPDLWRSLKGGSNNFGIVTRFTARSFPSTKIWSGFLYMPAFQAPKVLAGFHEFVNRADSSDPSTSYDKHAAGPIACFTYIHQIGIQAISLNLVHTKPPGNGKKWPICWKSSSFASLWRLWSTCKIQTLTNATSELNALNPPGKRQGSWGTTTIKNDLVTLGAAHAAFVDAIASLRASNVKNLVWTLVLQPFLPDWVHKGDPNPLGLQDCDEPLVIVSFTANWTESRDDEVVKTTTQQVVERIEAFAVANKTNHRFKYLNYCSEWQRPFEGYGNENLLFLKRVSQKYDPEGLFQRGCAGGFKLNVMDDHV